MLQAGCCDIEIVRVSLSFERLIDYASWAPIFWPFLRSSGRAPTIKAVRGTVAGKGVFDDKKKGAVRSPYRGGSVPLTVPLVPPTDRIASGINQSR